MSSDNHEHNPSEQEYYTEQLLTLLVCGATGVVSILMYQFDRLGILLAPQFHTWVLAGGIVLTLISVVRGIVLWKSVSMIKNQETHEHNEDCNHEHDDHNHGNHSHHDHAHMPGAIYIKLIPLSLPLLLFFMGLPNAGFSQEWINRRLGEVQNLGELVNVAEVAGDVNILDFAELNMAAYDPAKREYYQGRRVRVKGQLQSVSEKDYTLYKLKMTCCAADVIPLKARIKSEVVIPRSIFKDNDWVTVEGVLQFAEVPDKRGNIQYIPVFRIGEKLDGLQPATPE